MPDLPFLGLWCGKHRRGVCACATACRNDPAALSAIVPGIEFQGCKCATALFLLGHPAQWEAARMQFQARDFRRPRCCGRDRRKCPDLGCNDSAHIGHVPTYKSLLGDWLRLVLKFGNEIHRMRHKSAYKEIYGVGAVDIRNHTKIPQSKTVLDSATAHMRCNLRAHRQIIH